MTSETDTNPEVGNTYVNKDAVSVLIRAMNLAAGKLFAYPEGHPFVIDAFRKVEDMLQNIFQSHRQLFLKIAKDKIIVGPITLDEKNPVFQRFARTLFEHGIIGLILLRGLTSEELMAFDTIISQRRNDVYRQGGITALLEKANIRHIQTRLIDYGLFQAQNGPDTDGKDSEDLKTPLFWENFVKGLFETTPGKGEKFSRSWVNLDPETLAVLLNDTFSRDEREKQDKLKRTFQAGLKNLDLKRLSGDEGLSIRFFQFIQSLNDDLRHSFIETFFSFLPDEDDAATGILSNLPDEIILDALERHTNSGLYIPPNILRISQKLAALSPKPDLKETDEHLKAYSRNELLDRFKIIFKEDEIDRFIPLDYQRILRDVIVADTISAPELSRVPQLQKTLNDLSIDASLLAVIVNIIDSYPDRGIIPENIIRSLKDRCSRLIENGDFRSVLNILTTTGQKIIISAQNNDKTRLIKLLTIFSDRDFAEKILMASAQWGKEKQIDITKLVMLIGPSFVDPLLDRLAEEENKPLRLYFLDLLKGMGASARDRIIERLTDSRWYYVRNLLVVLRHLNDISILPSIRHLSSHSHATVRQELLHTLLALKDPKAEQLLLAEMESSDMDQCLKAITLAGMAQNRAITLKLAEFLRVKGFRKGVFETKYAAVQALAAIGDVSVLPDFHRVLKSYSLFSSHKLNLLKLEIITSLGKYPAESVIPLLEKIANGRSATLAKRASFTLKGLKVGKT